ncbi:MAG TPA: hypothetical protein VG324_00220 [Blastocatellia bacterium]|nr:hypothetical protein [Blastocatellia bacterium]
MDCPLVRLAKYRKLLKKFDETGKVAIPLDEWSGFFEALAYIDLEGGRKEIYCGIQDGYMFFSKTPLKRKSKLKQQTLHDICAKS